MSDAPRYPQAPHPTIFLVPVCTLSVQCWPYSARIPVWGRRYTLEFLHNNGILSDGAPPSFAPFPAGGVCRPFSQQVQWDLSGLLWFISGGGGQCCAQKCVSVADVWLHMKKYDRVVAMRRELMFLSLSDWFTFLENLLREDYRHCCTHKHTHTLPHLKQWILISMLCDKHIGLFLKRFLILTKCWPLNLSPWCSSQEKCCLMASVQHQAKYIFFIFTIFNLFYRMLC